MRISPYNINFGNIDNAHVAVIKKQLESGIDIPIRYYTKDGHKWVIDGGHTLTAYHELGREPPVLLEVTFTTPEDMIALSRHSNVNRIIQKPITYTESITKEIKLRLGIDDTELMSVFVKFSMAKQRGDDSAVANVHNSERVLTDIFQNEQITVGTFRSEYLPLLKLPNEVKLAIDNGKLAKTLGSELARIKEPRTQQELGRIAQEEKLSVSEIREIRQTINENDCSINHATADVLEARACKRRYKSPEYILNAMRSKVRENRQPTTEGTITEFSVKCLKCHQDLSIQHLEPSGKHRLKTDTLTAPYGARVTDEIDDHITRETARTGKSRSRIATDLMRLGFEVQSSEQGGE